MESHIEILLVNWGREIIGVAAEGTKALRRLTEDDDLPSLLECAGLGKAEETNHPVVLTVQLDKTEQRFQIPRPTALIEMAFSELRPFPKLLRPLLKLNGLAALAPYHGTVIAIFDPSVIAQECAQ